MGKRHHKYDYFSAFESLSELAVDEADLLIKAIEEFSTADALKETMEKAHAIEHKGDDINHDIFRNVATDFITPIDREDIIGLAQALDTIIDELEEVIQRFYMYDVHFMHKDALEFAQLLKKECKALNKAMEDFRNFKKSKSFKSLIVKVHDHEEQADQLYIKVIRQLHVEDRENPMRVLVWSKLFDSMEACCDACERASDVMSTIMLKNV